MQLGQALFFDLSSSVLKLPASVINALHVDEVGQIWFFVTKPCQNASEFQKDFQSRLDFYRKGESFYIHVAGKARIVNDPEEINSVIGISEEAKRLANHQFLLLRLKIEETSYFPLGRAGLSGKHELSWSFIHPSTLLKSLQYIVKDIIPVFQSH